MKFWKVLLGWRLVLMRLVILRSGLNWMLVFDSIIGIGLKCNIYLYLFLGDRNWSCFTWFAAK